MKDTGWVGLRKGDLQNTHRRDAPAGAVAQSPCVRLLISPAPEREKLSFEVRFHFFSMPIKVLSLCGRICQLI